MQGPSAIERLAALERQAVRGLLADSQAAIERLTVVQRLAVIEKLTVIELQAVIEWQAIIERLTVIESPEVHRKYGQKHQNAVAHGKP
jgi:UDP-3-O-[3-hydroxymyristoyl] glucosamine N-acyltransferase